MPMKVKELIDLIKKDGWVLARQRGSHRQYRCCKTRHGDGVRQAEHRSAARHVEQCTEAGRAEKVRRVMKYLVVVEQGPASYGAYVPDLPGCIAAGQSRDEVMALIHEAIEFHLEGLEQEGLSIPQPHSSSEFVEVHA